MQYLNRNQAQMKPKLAFPLTSRSPVLILCLTAIINYTINIKTPRAKNNGKSLDLIGFFFELTRSLIAQRN